MNIVATVQKVNRDPREDAWEWVLLDHRYQPLAVSWRSYSTKKGAWESARKYARRLQVGIVSFDQGGAS